MIVHETELSKHIGNYDEGNSIIPVTFGGHTFNVTVPEKSVRIVGFEVTPRSVPLGMACMSNIDPEDMPLTEGGG